jgi:hypothetical protein
MSAGFAATAAYDENRSVRNGRFHCAIDQTHLNIVPHYARNFRRRRLSPLIVGLPTPARLSMPSALGTLARAARSVKYFSVRSADSFSATATLMN